MDALFRIFVFGLVSALIYRGTLDIPLVTSIALSIVGALVVAGVWRAFGMSLTRRVVRIARIHQDDGYSTAWQTLIHAPGLNISQLSVHTKDGRTLYQNDFITNEFDLGEVIFGGDGSILMVVEEEELPDGSEEVRQGTRTDDGTRLTYIPKDQIHRVNVRVKQR